MSDAKNTILQAATELFLEGGSSALSVRAISKRAGVSTIGIYSHFNGKQGILDELYIEGFEKIFSIVDIIDTSV
ncbi:MAG: AcrR family transcriptional regulator, partial [Paraglaciecola sp.]